MTLTNHSIDSRAPECPPRGENVFRVLVGAQAFMDALYADLDGCTRSLYAQFMTYEGDTSGEAFSALLAEKAAAGLDVRLMVDGYSDVILSDVYPILVHRRGEVQRELARTQGLFERLRAEGVGVKRTAPPGAFKQYMLYRNHKKMVVLDERIAYVGGINISDHNYAWHDFMVRMEGPLAADLARDFLSTWDGATIPFTERRPGGDFVLNQCAGRYSIFEEVLDMIGRARHSVVIESPYLLGDHVEAALRAAAERGVGVTIIQPAHSNKLMYRIWVRKLRRRLDHPNVRIYGYRGSGGMTHAKLIVVDDQWASFGSFNMIELEGLTQKELNIFSSDPALIAQLKAVVAVDLQVAVPLTPPRTSWGRFTYSMLYHFFRWWTRRLLRRPDWKALYC
ncbi:MAG TPA: phosphatidylserine/phosphatidylglycerophosphate/cardiolipin synthase family protein [Aggregatilinea sp.]|uniref:phospholipase D-like domain-containing protein n=1 Tax=Aggregatilinea sp. TaxID=2806333 RepID=UPI002C312BE4|nr:phosphatidylserine/phosphatidylglycerophosphate/cardiolipin synthase family protein [Aggregatilinea sp.]HML23644.1 phosphatidylserine/phosphatidylglycerophosphate/cardiolipin synthase family protein [Aggregatilinea sp.]